MFKYLILGLMAISLFTLSGCGSEGGSEGGSENAALERELVKEYNDLEGEYEDVQSVEDWAWDKNARRKLLRISRSQVNVLKKLCDINPEAEVGITTPSDAKYYLSAKEESVEEWEEIVE